MKIKKSLSIVISIAVPLFTSGDLWAKNLCDDLATFSLAPGRYEDGTGSAQKEPSIFERSQMFEKYRQEFRERADDYSTSAVGFDFARTLVESFGISCDPSCAKMIKGKKFESSQVLTNALNAYEKLLFDELLNWNEDKKVIVKEQTPSRFTTKPMFELDYLTKHTFFIKEKKALRERILSGLELSKVESKLPDVFSKIVPIMKEVVTEYVSDTENRTLIHERLDHVRFNGVDCSSMSSEDQMRTMYPDFLSNAFYDSRERSVTYCKGKALWSDSSFTIVGILAHELGHSIDPCNIAKGPGSYRFEYENLENVSLAEAEFPFTNLISCLRDSRSVEAERIDIRKFDERLKSYPIQNGPMIQANSVMSKLPKAKHSILCSLDGEAVMDQIGEAFSDWIGMEVLARYMEKYHPQLTPEQFSIGYSNVFRSLGIDTLVRTLYNLDEHPVYEKRVNQIILAHPKVRAQMACEPKSENSAVHCLSEFKRPQTNTQKKKD